MRQDLVVPDTWSTLEEFAHWFMDNGYPMRVPADMQVYVTDDTYSCIVFRHDVYQAELYFIAPNMPMAKHSHTFENITILVGWSIRWLNEVTLSQWIWDSEKHKSWYLSHTLEDWKWHWFESFSKGTFMYVLEKWKSPENMTSATLEYKWKSLWPIHDELLGRHKKKAT